MPDKGSIGRLFRTIRWDPVFAHALRHAYATLLHSGVYRTASPWNFSAT